MRVSTQTFYEQSRSAISTQQESLYRVQAQIGSMTKILTPSDDPVGSTRVLAVSQSIALSGQYVASRTQATQTLSLEDSTLQSVTTVLQNVKGLLIEAGNGTMSDSDRLTIAGTLQSSLEQLHGLANTDDGNGQFLFAGFKSSSAPFSKQSDGSIAYSGDQGKRLVQVDVDRQMAISDDGRSIFQSVQDGAGYVSTSSTANAGSGVFSATSIINTADTSFGKDFVVSFPTATTYQIDTTGTPATSITPATPFKPGAAIGFAGLQISISGAPAAGDTFSVSTAKNAGTDVFAAISDVISALKIPLTGGGAPAQAKVFNALSTANRKIDNSLNNVLTTTSSVGSRLQELVSLGTTGDNRNLYDKIYLSSLQDLDYASAISELYQRKTSLQASQQTFVKLQKDALINYI